MASYTYKKRSAAKKKQWSLNANAKQARDRLESTESIYDQYERERRKNILLKIITISDPRTGETNRLQIWNGRGAAVNQVCVFVNGKAWKPMGRSRLAKALAAKVI